MWWMGFTTSATDLLSFLSSIDLNIKQSSHGVLRYPSRRSRYWQAVEKRPSAAFPSSFVVSSTGQACCDVPVGAIHELPLRQDFACLRVATSAKGGAPPQTGFRKAQLASACLRVAPPCGAEAGAFLISLKKNEFFNMFLNLDDRIRAMDILEWVEERMEPKKMRVADFGMRN